MKNEILSSGIADAADNSHVPTATADSVTFTPQLQMPAMTVPTSTASAYVVPSTTAGAYVTPCNIPFISTGILLLAIIILYVYYHIASYINCMDICRYPYSFGINKYSGFKKVYYNKYSIGVKKCDRLASYN